MLRLKSLKLSTRLPAGYGSLITMLVLVALVSLYGMTHIQKNFDTLLSRDFTSLKIVNSMRDALRLESLALHDMATPQSLQQTHQQYHAAQASIRVKPHEDEPAPQTTKPRSSTKPAVSSANRATQKTNWANHPDIVKRGKG